MVSGWWRKGVWLGWAAAFLAVPAPAFALQTHAYEGLYLHQLAHIFFLAAMVFFASGIRRSWLSAQRSWRLMEAGAWLLALWNLWAFGGHFIEVLVTDETLLRPPGQLAPQLVMRSWREVVYFIVKMDHLLTVPAIFCFYFGMRGILQDTARGSSPSAGGIP